MLAALSAQHVQLAGCARPRPDEAIRANDSTRVNTRVNTRSRHRQRARDGIELVNEFPGRRIILLLLLYLVTVEPGYYSNATAVVGIPM